ncbi:uncharacterized protein L969DRAFT_88867 [Mixia osmundae IAM 14324]|uniref:Coatomer subunit delta n=1 Tax=Mixia osmundae (strain CBS 9802 / IAM 14324 / JCM 22182 / KY 12970) TaxID=764103 RepID=G7E7L8_MIXOS|nr:uncharacterized protein L969DRAFT_88867 [Mixia osmundae IAM 14324]KEI38429.1 hypothetical protein L969DRAFT_88867 [Mixia osmundae IAM 14324]GAA98828.1 hypothetical protein E5Q_05516 [Mixia osmundae IAM 14324]
MVILACSIVTKGGKPLVSRQFNPSLSRSRIESLLLSFPKLIPPGVQHTTLLSSDKSVRYVYMPLEELYILLITPPLSNILQDLETLRLVSRIVSEICSLSGRGSVTESDVSRCAFELLSSFDEVVSLGYRERVGMQEVRAAMEMESHEERLQEMIARNKEQEAKEELKRRAKQLEMQRREMAKRGQTPYGAQGMSNGSGGGYDRAYIPPTLPPVQRQDYSSSPVPSAQRPVKNKGMQLGASSKMGARKNADLIDALGGEVAEAPSPVSASAAYGQPSPQSAVSAAPAHAIPAPAPPAKADNPFAPDTIETIHLAIKEKVTMEVNRDGGLNSFELKGDLDLRITDPEHARIAVGLGYLEGFGSDLQFRTHPNVDKKAWSDSKKLALRDAKKSFPVGQGLGVLRWRMTTKDESIVPLTVNCWPSPTDHGSLDVTIEYELQNTEMALHNVIISIPLPAGAYPTVTSDDATYAVNPTNHTLDWELALVDQDNSSGAFEFSLPSDDADSLFPIDVDFIAEKGLCGVEVLSVTQASTGEPMVHSTESLLSTEGYSVV